MTKRPEEWGKPEPEHTSIFVKKNWPLALVITGTVAGAAIWLTVRYLRNRKSRSQQIDNNLAQLENEATTGQNPTVQLLDGGSFLGNNVSGDEVLFATDDIAQHLDDIDGRQAVITLGQIASIDSQGKRWS